jgi:predicted aminopeptidase
MLATVLAVSGCKTLSFYAQAAKGQYQIFAHARPIERLMSQPEIAPALKSRFELLERLRVYADKGLQLPVNGHYRKYVDLHRPYVVWNVEAASEFSMQPKTWWYPLVGSLEYRGYFSRPGATNYAAFLRKKGYDVSVGGVSAYSTLGWFKDPVLNTFLFDPDSELAETIFHELAHQRVFARGDTDFNEAFATTVGQEGTRRWLKTSGDESGLSEYLGHLERNRQFVQLVMKTRARLEGLYGDIRDEEGKVKSTNKNKGIPAQQLRAEKEKILDEMKQQFEKLRAHWGGPDPEYDAWFTHPVNNAHLNSVAAYYDLVPAFENLLALNGGDLGKFYIAAERLSKMKKERREEWLRTLAGKDGNVAGSLSLISGPRTNSANLP